MADVDRRADGRPGRIGRVGPIARGTLARAFEAAIVLWLLASLVFFALRLLPGDPAALVLGEQAGPDELARLRAKLHLDEPMWLQYARFWRGVVSFDLGDSIRRPGVRAAAEVGGALGPTAALAGVAVAIGAAVGIAAGLACVGPWWPRGRRWIARGVDVVAATPLLAFAPVATYALAARWRVVPLPGDPDAGAAGLGFASALLAVPLAAHVARVARASLADVARAQFLAVARAKGAGAARVWWRHALPPSLAPIVAVVATQLGALLGGAVVLERLFERPGLGSLILTAYASRDLPVLEGAVVASGALFVATQALAAAAHALIDPRVRDDGAA